MFLPQSSEQSDSFDDVLKQRLSSCSLDSVIGYLDELLGRRADDKAKSPGPTSETSATSCCSPPSGESGVSHEIQRVMDLSFASVYEVDARPVVSGPRSSMTVVTELIDPAADSGVESNKSDDDETDISRDESSASHDYQNVKISDHVIPPLAPPRTTSLTSKSIQSNLRKPSRRVNSKTRTVQRQADYTDNKVYEICLGHLCVTLEAGSASTGRGTGDDRWISIYSLQKHHDELIQLGSSPSPSTGSSASSSAPNQHNHHHHQPQQPTPRGHPAGANTSSPRPSPQRHAPNNCGPGANHASPSRQGSHQQDDLKPHGNLRA